MLPDSSVNLLESGTRAIELGGRSLGYRDPFSIPVFRSRAIGRFLTPGLVQSSSIEYSGQVHYPAIPGCTIQNTYGASYPSFAGFSGLRRVTVEVGGVEFGSGLEPSSGPFALDGIAEESRLQMFPRFESGTVLRLSITGVSDGPTTVETTVPDPINAQIEPPPSHEPNTFDPSMPLRFSWVALRPADPRRLRIRLISRLGSPPVTGSASGRFSESVFECVLGTPGEAGSVTIRLGDHPAWIWPGSTYALWLLVDTIVERRVMIDGAPLDVRTAFTSHEHEFTGRWGR
jgi:hypothetical protein